MEEGRDLVSSLATLDSGLSLGQQVVALSVGENLSAGECRNLVSSLTTLDSSLLLDCMEKDVASVMSVFL